MRTTMRQVLFVVDVQASFSPPATLINNISSLLPLMPSVATVERHDESRVPFRRQLNWAPRPDDRSLIAAVRAFTNAGCSPPPEVIDSLPALNPARVLGCCSQADTGVLPARFA